MATAGISPKPFFFDFRAAVSMVHESLNGLELQDHENGVGRSSDQLPMDPHRPPMKHTQTAPSTLDYVRLGTSTPLDRLWMPTAAHEGSRATDTHLRTPQIPMNTRGTPGPPLHAYNPPTNTNLASTLGGEGTRRGVRATRYISIPAFSRPLSDHALPILTHSNTPINVA
ncbi:hypothetical protein BDZ97DRAFT_2074310 [Flammula alnicola]|nr:hypothetical protein BDZ97DRAFT_2074310 [Flammula alnicola]